MQHIILTYMHNALLDTFTHGHFVYPLTFTGKLFFAFLNVIKVWKLEIVRDILYNSTYNEKCSKTLCLVNNGTLPLKTYYAAAAHKGFTEEEIEHWEDRTSNREKYTDNKVGWSFHVLGKEIVDGQQIAGWTSKALTFFSNSDFFFIIQAHAEGFVPLFSDRPTHTIMKITTKTLQNADFVELIIVSKQTWKRIWSRWISALRHGCDICKYIPELLIIRNNSLDVREWFSEMNYAITWAISKNFFQGLLETRNRWNNTTILLAIIRCVDLLNIFF